MLDAAANVLDAAGDERIFVNGPDRPHISHPLGAEYPPSPGNSEESYNIDENSSYPPRIGEDSRTAAEAPAVAGSRPCKFPEYKH